jgi:hypothetical protein
MEPEPAVQAVAGAFQAAAGLPDFHRRTGLLARLAPVLPSDLVDQALGLLSEVPEPDDRGRLASALAVRLQELGRAADSVTTANDIEDEYWRAAALTSVATKLADGPEHRLGIDAARRIPYLHWQSEAMVRLAVLQPDGGPVVAEAVENVRQVAADSWKATALARLAPHLPEGDRAVVFAESVEAAGRLDKPHDRWYCITHIAGCMAAAGQAAEAMKLIDSIEDHYWKADLLLRIVPLLPDALLNDALGLARSITHHAERARVFGALMPRFGELPAQQLHAVWADTLHLLASGTRQELLLVLPGLLPAFGRLGGPGAMVECAQIVESVRRWWP